MPPSGTQSTGVTFDNPYLKKIEGEVTEWASQLPDSNDPNKRTVEALFSASQSLSALASQKSKSVSRLENKYRLNELSRRFTQESATMKEGELLGLAWDFAYLNKDLRSELSNEPAPIGGGES
jgi:hypothetical protein